MLELRQGGPILLVLLALLFYAAYVFFERFLAIRKERVGGEKLMREIEGAVRRGQLGSAIESARLHGGILGRFMLAGLSRATYGTATVEASLRAALIEEEARLTKNLASLSVLAQAAPLVGLLGTVTGMIRAFNVLSAQGEPTAALLAEGIGEALFNTAGGLFVAIPALVGYYFLAGRVDKIVGELDQRREELLGILSEVSHAPAKPH